jgi:hypothetical protein
MNDKQAGVAMTAVIELADAMRDNAPASTKTAAATRVLNACGGNPLAALCLIAVVVPPEHELDAWWQDQHVEVGVRRRPAIEQAIARFGFDQPRVIAATGCTRQEYRVVARDMDEQAVS